MSVFHPYTYQDPFGKEHTVFLAKTLNIDRIPEAREQILEGNFQRVNLGDESESVQVSRPFTYLDSGRNTLILVYQQFRKHRWKEHSQQLKRVFATLFKGKVLCGDNPYLRVVYGMNELREKLLLQSCELDDRQIELTKAALLYEHSFLLDKNRINICLTDVFAEHLAFQVFFDHEPTRFLSLKPREDFDKFSKNTTDLQRWSSAHSESILDLEQSEDYYVNAKRWSPRLPALTILESYGRTLEEGGNIDVFSADFEMVIKALPRGDHLAPWGKKVLFEILKHLRSRHAERGMKEKIKTFFDLRFEKSIEGDWLNNDIQTDVDTIWQLFENLPDSHIEGNSFLTEIKLGAEQNVYDPTTYQIEIHENLLPHQEEFEDMVRHEIGHAVHKKHQARVDNWLVERFGWHMFDPKKEGELEQWLSMIGEDVTDEEMPIVKETIIQILGTTKWAAGPGPDPIDRDHPWHRDGFTPQKIFKISYPPGNRHWYQEYDNWMKHDGYAFAYNFYYKTLMAVKMSTIDLITEINKPYAAMSPPEFFAELYELYYDWDDDRSGIPQDIKDWMDTNLD